MTQKWNLQDIRPATPRKRRIVQEDAVEMAPRPPQMPREEAEEEMSIRIVDGNKKKNKSLLYAIIIFVVIVGGGLMASSLMGGAEVTVYPRHREPNVNAVFTALRTPQPEELAYEIMTLEAEGERQVTASGQEQVSTQALGTIFIYNEQQKEPIRLVTNTRFESPEGLIFKIKDPAIVPGYTTDQSGKKVPGVTTAEVYADEVGEKYNIGASKFTIPGFKGEPEYSTIYAESTSAFTGGFDGMKFIIDQSELEVAQQALRTELRNSLLERIDAEKPAGFILFKDAVTFTYESLPSVEYGENLATIKEKVLLRIPLFKEDEFANYLAQATIPGYEGEDVRVQSYDGFTFAYTNATTSSSDISNAMSLEFNLTGKPQIVWKYDAEKLKADLVNANKTALTSILGAYPAIEKANAVIRPFWKTKFPTKMDEIKVIEVVEPQE
jgi:hypothetical protein